MQVATKSKGEGEKPSKEYNFSWVGENGQPGSQSIVQGAQCYILPEGQTDRASVQLVTFLSFQMKGASVGGMRYKTQEDKYLTLLPGAVGPRFLLPQMEHWGVHVEQQPPLPYRERADSPARQQQQAATSSGAALAQAAGSSRDQQEEEAPSKRQKTEEQKAERRARDEQAQSACSVLQRNTQWQGKVKRSFTTGTTEIDSFQLHKSARCNAFGTDRYVALKKITFYRCSPCGTVFTGRRQAIRHKCTGPGGRSRRGRATGILPGGIRTQPSLQ